MPESFVFGEEFGRRLVPDAARRAGFEGQDKRQPIIEMVDRSWEMSLEP